VRAELGAEGAEIVLKVTDTGRGIDAAFLPHVSEMFRQAESTTNRTHGGLGLGLSIVRRLVELHGGSVSAESAGFDRGATFTVRLAQRKAGFAPDARRAEEQQPA
jgi:signal transduction histidine kinase